MLSLGHNTRGHLKKPFFAFGLPFWRFSFAALKLSNSGQGPQTGDNFLTRHSTETGFQNGKIALKNIFEMGSNWYPRVTAHRALNSPSPQVYKCGRSFRNLLKIKHNMTQSTLTIFRR
jgi:hypothetical protein